MVILHIITALGYGGAEVLLKDLANEILKKHVDYQFHVIYFKDLNKIGNQFDKKVFIHHVPLNYKTLISLRKKIKQINPDIIHTHLGHADFLGHSASIFLKAKKFCTMHNIWYKKNFLDYVIFVGYFILFQIISPRAKVISISKAVNDHVKKWYKLSSKRNFLLYNAVSKNSHSQVQFSGKSEKEFIVLFVGRLSKQKNVQLLLKAFKVLNEEYPHTKLWIIGEGEEEKKLKQLTHELMLNNKVVFWGAKNEIDSWMKKANVLVLPSIFEGFGLVILEAFKNKLPVIASDIEGPQELIAHNQRGFLFETNNLAKLVECLCLVINHRNLNAIIDNAYSFFLHFNSIETYAEKVLDLYKS
jgi:glycosyltransferase involved in cell wall biosynthesis